MINALAMSIAWQLSVDSAEFVALNRELVSFFRRKCPPASDPSDLAANTWIRIVRWYKGECSLRHFAFLVARGTLGDARRKRQILTIPLSDEESGEPFADDPNLDSLLMLAAHHEAMERALNHETVTDVFRDVFVLWLKGLDYCEIAAELGIPYNTVRSRLNRGKVQVINVLRAEFDA